MSEAVRSAGAPETVRPPGLPAEHAFARSDHHVRQLVRLGERLDEVSDDVPGVPAAVVEAVLAMPCTAAVVWMLDESRVRLTARHSGHVSPGPAADLAALVGSGALDVVLDAGTGRDPGVLEMAAAGGLGTCLTGPRPDELAALPGLPPALTSFVLDQAPRSLAVVPVRGRSELLGVLLALRLDARPLDGVEMDLLGIIGRRAGVTLDAARLVSAVQEQAAIVESVSDAILATDADGVVTTWNGGCERLYGIAAQEALGRSLGELVPSMTFEDGDLESVLASLAKEGRWRGRITQRSLAGRTVEVEAHASARWSRDGEYIGFVSIMRDLTEVLTAQATAQRHSRFSEELMDALDSPAAVLDADGLVLTANARWRAKDGQRELCVCGPVPPGVSWLMSLRTSAGVREPEAAVFADEVASVLAGHRAMARLECRCAPGGSERACAIEVVRLHGAAGAALVVQSDVSWRRRLEDELSHRALHDDLTGLPNRAALVSRLDASLRRLDGHHMLAVLFCDLDGFKDINDGLGHAVGDQVLVAVARRLRQRCRSADVVARFGGDEFVVVLPVPDVSRAVAMADRLVEVLGEPIVVGDAEVAPGASIGITVVDACPDVDDPVGTLLRDADTAMYHAKERGRGRYEIFDSSLRTNIAERLELASALRRATMDAEFELVYQSRRTCGSRQVCGVEALLRWRHPALGQVAPGDFVPIAERTGRIVQVGGWALRRALSEVAELEDRRLSVAVNVSPRQLTTPRFVEMVDRALATSGLEPWRLTLEITEGALVDDPVAARGVLADLRRLGTMIALDDFGTGWSSMSYLRTLPVDVLKIDRSFVADLPTDPDACAVVSAVLGLGHGMGLVVVAEGVERLDQLDVLRDMGCDEYQGFIDGPPGVLARAVDPEP